MNKEFFERGKLLIEQNILKMDTLKPVPFSLPFDWNNHFGMGDTFIYRMQSFRILRYFCAFHEDSNSIQALETACRLIEDWLKQFSQTAPKSMENRFGGHAADNAFIWHDHATALRAENWLLFMEYCREHVPDFWADRHELREYMKSTLAKHGRILAEDAFYSAHCNHGIEQARVLLRLAEEPSLADLPETDQTSWRTIAIARLTDEFNTCFTSEGVHKENSPGYHQFVFKTLLNILDDPHLHAAHDVLKVRFDRMAQQALEYIAYILQPNLRLPIIGDTEHLPVTDSFHAALGTTEAYVHYLYAATAGRKGIMPANINRVYPEAGYAIFRNSWNKDTYSDMFHLVCKAGCLVRYHHQLDEGQFVLFARGEHWFIDSGFFDYDRSSALYKYIRSRKAHNVPLIFGTKLKNFDERVQSWQIDSWSETPGNAHVCMVNTIYENVALKRHIDYPGAYEFTLTDEVECNDGNEHDVQFFFHIPKDKQIFFDENNIFIKSSRNECIIKIDSTDIYNIKILKGKNSKGEIRSQVSWRMKQCEDSYVVLVYFKNIKTLKCQFCITIKDISLKDGMDNESLPGVLSNNSFPENLKTSLFLDKTKFNEFIVFFLPSLQKEEIDNFINQYSQNNSRSFLVISTSYSANSNQKEEKNSSYEQLYRYWDSLKQTLSSFKKILFLVIDSSIVPACELASQEGERATVLAIDSHFISSLDNQPNSSEKNTSETKVQSELQKTIFDIPANFHLICIQSRQSSGYTQHFLPWIKKECHSRFLSETLRVNTEKFVFSYDNLKNIVDNFFAENIEKSFPKSFLVKNFSTSDQLQFYFEYRDTLTIFSLPVKWNMDPYHKPNWMLNFSKLRWLEKVLSPDDIIPVFINFYHFNQKYTNKYCHTSTGDHSMAERIYLFIKYIELYRKTNNIRGVNICMRLVRLDIAALLNSKIYRPGCNHGLMADLALIFAYKKNWGLINEKQFEYIINRSIKTFNSIFADNGISKEHSVAYQLFNIPLALRFLNELKNIDTIEKLPRSPQVLLEKSKEFLGFFLAENGTFIPLGDTHRLPDIKLLSQCYKNGKNPTEYLLPYSQMEGLRYWPQGYLVWRDKKRDIHFTFTCGRYSATHKHDDELSFCLRVRDIPIIDECGFTEVLSYSDYMTFSSSHCHSTVFFEDKEWLPKNIVYDTSHMDPPTDDKYFRASHKRIDGFEIIREIEIVESVNKIKFIIIDTIIGKKAQATHRFILGPDIIPQNDADGPILTHKGRNVGRFLLPNACHWKMNHVPYIGLSPDKLMETSCIDVISDELQLTVILEIDQDPVQKTHLQVTHQTENIISVLDEEDYFIQDRKIYENFEKKMQSVFLKNIIDDAYIDALFLYRFAHEALIKGDTQTAKHCEILNKILNNCIIPSSCHIGQGTRLGYGGLGILIHANTQIGKYCTIGTNVTMAAAPNLGDFVYVETGAKIIGRKLSIGRFSIIEANAVVTHDVPPCSIVTGIPSRVVKTITPENIENYLTSYLAAARKTEQDFVKSVRNEFMQYYSHHYGQGRQINDD